MKRVMALAFLLSLATSQAHAAACVEGPPPAPPRRVNANNGLPALAAMVLAGGGGVGLLALFSGAVGTVGAFERADRREDTFPLLGVVAVLTTGLLAVSALTLLLGAGIWLVAWLPPITDTRVRCPPPPA
jgi:hypothetical protein